MVVFTQKQIKWNTGKQNNFSIRKKNRLQMKNSKRKCIRVLTRKQVGGSSGEKGSGKNENLDEGVDTRARSKSPTSTSTSKQIITPTPLTPSPPPASTSTLPQIKAGPDINNIIEYAYCYNISSYNLKGILVSHTTTNTELLMFLYLHYRVERNLC